MNGADTYIQDCNRPPGFSRRAGSTVTVLSLVILSIMFTLFVPAVTSADENVFFYAEKGYSGTSTALPPGAYDKQDLISKGISTHSMKSFKISGELKVTLFQDDKFNGECVTYLSDQGDISGIKASSLIIAAPTKTKIIPTFHEHSHQRGRSIALGIGMHDENVLNRLGNKVLSSISIPSDTIRVTLYKNGNFTGDSVSYHDTHMDLPAEWKNRTQSIIIEYRPTNTGKVKFFNQTNYGGVYDEFGIGRYDRDYLARQRVGGHAVRSVKVPKGLKVTLFTTPGFSGDIQVCTYDTAVLPDHINGKISSIVIEEHIPSPSAVFYDTYNCENSGKDAKPRELTIGRYNQAVLDNNDDEKVGNDAVSSIKIPAGLKVTIYEKDNFQGKRMTFYSDVMRIGKYMDNKTSSIIIEKWNDPGATTFLFVADPQIGDDASVYIANERIRDVLDCLELHQWPSRVHGKTTRLDLAGQPISPQYIVFGGDLVNYPAGDKMGIFKKYWDYKDNPGTSVQMFSYACLGNHDLAGGEHGMIDFLNAMNLDKDTAPQVPPFSTHPSKSFEWWDENATYLAMHRFGGDNVGNRRGDQFGKIQSGDPKFWSNESLPFIRDCFSARDSVNKIFILFQHYFWEDVEYWTLEEQERLQMELDIQSKVTQSPFSDRIIQFQGHDHGFWFDSTRNAIVCASASPEWGEEGISYVYLVRVTGSRLEVVEIRMPTTMTQETPIDLEFNRVGIFDITKRPVLLTKKINFQN